MDIRATHRRGKCLLWRCRVGEIDDHEARRTPTGGVDTEKCVELSVDALDFCRVHAWIGERGGVTGDELRLDGIRQTIDRDRSRRELGGDDEQLAVVGRLDVSKRAD